MTVARYTIFVLGLALLAPGVKAQQDGLNFINFSSRNGLSSNTTNAILKDRLGYMWFATEDGLNKFDGTAFRVYNHNELDSNSIGANQVQTIYEDPQGNLWIGTNRTLSLYDRQKDCFHNYYITNGTAVRAICTDGSGKLWVGSYDGLTLYDPVNHQIRHFNADSSRAGQLRSNTIICLLRDNQGRLWAGSNSGLYLYQPATSDFKRFINIPSDPGSLSDNVVKAIAEDSSGHLWFGTNNGGLDRLQEDGCHFRRFKNNPADVTTLSSNRVYSVVPESTGKLWVGTEDGLNIFDLQSGKVLRVKDDDRNKYSLKGRSVRSIFVDPRGIYWVATNQGGINKYDKNLPFFNLVQYNPFDPEGLSSPRVTSFSEAVNGDIYVGTDGGGLNLYHRATGLFEHIAVLDPDLHILALERRGSELWIGTFRRGLFVLDTRTRSIRHYDKGNAPRELPSDDIFCIKSDRLGNMWLGTNGSGVCMWDPHSGNVRRFGPTSVSGNGSTLLSNGFIRAIEEDNAGNMLIGTVGSGVVLYDPLRRTCRVFNRANTGLPLDEVITLHIDRKGTVWAGTPSGGLCRLGYPDNKFNVYSEQQGLANAVVYKILEDDAGKLWVSTNKGLSCFDPENATFKNYMSENGLQESSFNMGAGLKTAATGELFFGGIEGFNYFRPAALTENKIVPDVIFTDLKIGGRSVVPGKDLAVLEHVSIAGEIRVDYRQNFSVDFAALDYTTPAENRYMYKLDGLDRSWNELGMSRTAVFTNLYPGHYTLEVRAKNCNGAWITKPVTIKIYVKPPFWLTGYAYAAYVLLFGLILWGIRYRGIRKIRARFALEQERLRMKQVVEQERREAERLHEFDQLKIKFLTNLSHELRTPVSLIMGPVEKLQEQEADSDKRGQLAMVKRNARRLLNLVNQLLDFRKLEEHELKLNCTEGDIVSFIRDTAESFQDIAERKQIRFGFQTEVGYYFTSFDRDKIERVLFNLLGNAFKFTPKDGSISLVVKGMGPTDGLQIILTDTGIGMSEEERHRLFDRFFQGGADAGVMNQGSGIGLSITKEFVRLHDGRIEVESERGKGSVFTIFLPLANLLGGGGTSTVEVAAPEEAIAAEENPLTMVPALDKPAVLLVEDNEDFRHYLRDNLKHYYRIFEAADGKEGWQKALSRHPDVIVSDISMPVMDGIELSRKIRADHRVSHIPIILLTALTGNAYQLKGLETGASDYLTKPFPFEILNLKIRNLLSLNRLLKETYTRRLNVETPVAEVESEDQRLILKITQFIEANLDSPDLSVDELCKHMYMSHASLYRKIVDLTGEKPVEFIRSVKLNKALDLLERSDMKIAEIGYAVGFTTPNYFTRAFKAKFDISPSEYISQKRRSTE